MSRDADMSEPTPICQSCHAGCCRAFAVPITGADILRLERSTGLTFWDFVCRWEDLAGQIAGDYVPHLYFDDEPATPFTLCLLHEPSQLFPTTSKCRLLHETPADAQSPRGTSSCGVYGSRPMACRVFPLRTNTNSPLAILADVPSHGRPSDGHEAYQLCPRPWRPDDVDPIQAPQDLAVSAYESSFFHQVATLWNERPGSWLKFPEYLRLVYERRVIRPAESAEEAAEDEAITLPFPNVDRRSHYVA